MLKHQVRVWLEQQVLKHQVRVWLEQQVLKHQVQVHQVLVLVLLRQQALHSQQLVQAYQLVLHALLLFCLRRHKRTKALQPQHQRCAEVQNFS